MSRECFQLLVITALLISPAQAHGHRHGLWSVISAECVPSSRSGIFEKCLSVDLSSGEENGVAILKDLRGASHILAIPTRQVSGIEDAFLQTGNAPNYFAAAWTARKFVSKLLKRELPDEAIAIAVNSKLSRTQDQLHLHVDCIDIDVANALAAYGVAVDLQWHLMTTPLKERYYWIRRLHSVDLLDINPFQLLAEEVPGAKVNMDKHSLAIVARPASAGAVEFLLLTDSADSGSGGHSEDLQDLRCKIAE
ncbi:CDP-diacylglycerol diphosphatase [Bradyrhizobium tunisiense]|uniref:CDP-diacylglycerol diphosphatase n=1 Tax=Bradyrhizobium tunisiense TaxID=3278709 RepID=UPI0035DB5AD2